MNKSLENNRQNYDLKGTLMIPESEGPFNENEIKQLEQICKDVDKEFVKVGDAGEPNHVHVGRFMTDIKKPEIVNKKYSLPLIKILNQDKIIDYIKKSIGVKEKLYLRRIQFNQIDENCFVGYHLDIDSNPDYLVACVIQFGSNFDGGIYRVYKSKEKFKFTVRVPSLIFFLR